MIIIIIELIITNNNNNNDDNNNINNNDNYNNTHLPPPPPTNDLAQVFSLSVHQEMRKLKQLKTLATDGSASSVNILFPYIEKWYLRHGWK